MVSIIDNVDGWGRIRWEVIPQTSEGEITHKLLDLPTLDLGPRREGVNQVSNSAALRIDGDN